MQSLIVLDTLKKINPWFKTGEVQQNQLRYDSTGRERPVKEQKYKLGLLPLVIPVIKNATKIKKCEEQYSKKLGKYSKIWAITGNVGRSNTQVKVILRRIGDGNLTFFSVMKKRDKSKHQKNRKK